MSVICNKSINQSIKVFSNLDWVLQKQHAPRLKSRSNHR